MKPQTLCEIYKQVIRKRVGAIQVRVRNVETLVDYFLCNIDSWKWNHTLPAQMYGLLLRKPFNCHDRLDCGVAKYTLLSTPEEIEYIRSLGHSASIVIQQAYSDSAILKSLRGFP